MAEFLFYIIKSSVFILVLYFTYKLLLSKETFFGINRFVLIVGIIISSLLPFISVRTENPNIIQEQIHLFQNHILGADHSNILNYNHENFLEEEITHSENKAENATYSFTKIVFVIYVSGVLVSLILLCISLFKMIHIIRKGEIAESGKYKIILSDKNICPFSFGNYIVLSKNDYLQNPDEILLHEKIHADRKHSLDILFMEVFILLHWFNPAVWLLKKEIQDIHEYEADSGVIQSGINATKYQLLLVKKAVGARSYAIANSFNHSKIKKRITMMLQKKSNRRARLKLALLLPATVLTMYAFARPEVQEIEKELSTISSETPIASAKISNSEEIRNDSVPSPTIKKKKEKNTIVNGKRYTEAEWEEMKKDAVSFGTLKEYIPFAKGEVLEVYSAAGGKNRFDSPRTYFEKPFNGKKADFSHVQFLIDEKEYSLEEFSRLLQLAKKEKPKAEKIFQIKTKENTSAGVSYVIWKFKDRNYLTQSKMTKK